MDRKTLVILDPGGGIAIRSPTGGHGRIKVGVEETAGSLTIYESLRPAGDPGGPHLHKHLFDEAFYVLEGDYTFQVGERLVRASTGGFVYVPGGTVHTFRHSGDGDGRMLTVCSPGGIEAMFMAPDAESRAAAERKLGAENVGPPLAPD
ncbi:MAG TPA: cupin domain-containing protein [Candidatus Dormibacteraeota bacterium]|jgi:mannose-6-phosphate isomerase-like protein (cupin superfamily)|nr:cupin domain-containing protein [Candidatus Dormibacteraeota bacterium]